MIKTPTSSNTQEITIYSCCIRALPSYFVATDTPGALDVGVPAFVDRMLKEVYSKEGRDDYLNGLRHFATVAQQVHHKPFVSLERGQQRALVQRFQDEAIAEERALVSRKQKDLVQRVRAAALLEQRTRPSTDAHQQSFILATRELALLAFFTSQPGATRVLQYLAIPGAYRGCLPVSQAGNGRRWATVSE
ncbi:gluconate 2-dehydrogenase subunit 3 family protein [Streptomyces sp. WAC 06738]|uniref:gluconate 2-dehydrogenase subunit 3 family protein n=1 Tax=Streptomyces sp. WAC 06738 TaxID=2203210 RepID=UPI0019D158E9|nr:gluconate 2-dehydrogenase subunit 3 family protein [Streptomyces sp. WAC 06738]